MSEVMQAAESSHVKQLRDIQQTLSHNEPINIQFTSVGALHCSALQLAPNTLVLVNGTRPNVGMLSLEGERCSSPLQSRVEKII